MTRYDTIGRTYSSTRRTDPRIEARIAAALGDDTTGAGARRETMRSKTMRVATSLAKSGATGKTNGCSRGSHAIQTGDWSGYLRLRSGASST